MWLTRSNDSEISATITTLWDGFDFGRIGVEWIFGDSGLTDTTSELAQELNSANEAGALVIGGARTVQAMRPAGRSGLPMDNSKRVQINMDWSLT